MDKDTTRESELSTRFFCEQSILARSYICFNDCSVCLVICEGFQIVLRFEIKDLLNLWSLGLAICLMVRCFLIAWSPRGLKELELPLMVLTELSVHIELSYPLPEQCDLTRLNATFRAKILSQSFGAGPTGGPQTEVNSMHCQTFAL